MAAEAKRLTVSDLPVAVWKDRNAWKWRAGLKRGRRPSLASAKDAAVDAYVVATGDTPSALAAWRECDPSEAAAGLSGAQRTVPALARPVDRGPVEREPQTLREYLRILYGDVPARSLRYLEWIRTLPCCVCGMPGQSEAHHEPPKGIGGGHSTDYDAVPLCLGDHRIRHGQASGDADAVRAECERTRLLLLATYYAAEDAPVRLARA
jgi:hypothetical protein